MKDGFIPDEEYIEVDGQKEPVDPDAEDLTSPSLAHEKFLSLVAVFIGGSLGAFLRQLASIVFTSTMPLGSATFVVNIVGAFILGCLLEYLPAFGPDTGYRRLVRLCFGTGMMGGFTTYGGFISQTSTMILAHSAFGAAIYIFASIVLGFIAGLIGMRLGQLFSGAHSAKRSS